MNGKGGKLLFLLFWHNRLLLAPMGWLVDGLGAGSG